MEKLKIHSWQGRLFQGVGYAEVGFAGFYCSYKYKCYWYGGPSTIWTNLVEGRIVKSGYAKINFLRYKLNFGSINTEKWGPNF